MACAGITEYSTAASAPNWDQITEDIRCPLCDYNLRGLTEPRCPECGFRFSWPELLDPGLRHHPFLFEHHPKRNLWSFWKTVCGGLRPGRFWKSLHPNQPSRPRRMALYQLFCWSAFLLVSASLIIDCGVNLNRFLGQNRAMWIGMSKDPKRAEWVSSMANRYGSLQQLLDVQCPKPDSLRYYQYLLRQMRHSETAVVAGLFLIAFAFWPLATFATLQIFRWSMRRAKVRTIHVVRCVVYSFDGVFWCGVAVSLFIVAVILTGSRASQAATLGGISFFLVIIALPFMARRLMIAYRDYLRFDRPAATIACTQLIVALTTVLLWCWWIAVRWLY